MIPSSHKFPKSKLNSSRQFNEPGNILYSKSGPKQVTQPNNSGDTTSNPTTKRAQTLVSIFKHKAHHILIDTKHTQTIAQSRLKSPIQTHNQNLHIIGLVWTATKNCIIARAIQLEIQRFQFQNVTNFRTFLTIYYKPTYDQNSYLKNSPQYWVVVLEFSSSQLWIPDFKNS